MALKSAVPAPKTATPARPRVADPPTDGGWIRAAELRPLLTAMRSLRDGDSRVRPGDGTEGVPAEVAGTFHRIVARERHFSAEPGRVKREVVRRDGLDERLAESPGQGSWAMSAQAANATRVLDAVADGDLTQRVDLHDGSRPLRGDLRRPDRVVNGMVGQLSLFTGEVTRVAREVGTEGRLGGRAKACGPSGSRRDVTEAVNTVAARLTAQVGDFALVTTAVARGDLTREVTVEAARVAREVGTEGQLGGRTQVRGVSGVWKDPTGNVGFMACDLTSQVRNIAQVTTAVADGDLSRKITVDAQGGILQPKSTIDTRADRLSDPGAGRDDGRARPGPGGPGAGSDDPARPAS